MIEPCLIHRLMLSHGRIDATDSTLVFNEIRTVVIVWLSLRRLQGSRFLGLRVKITWATRYSQRVRCRYELEVKPKEDRGSDVEPLGDCDLSNPDGSQVILTQDLITYQFSHDMEKCSIREPLMYRGDTNMAVLGVVVVIEE
ncbi:hypothetical protein Tco_0221245 [Tanacetum coccineum]